VGPVADEANIAYLPPETAQGIFVNFQNVASTMRRKLPFGIAQVRKSFRNEITPGNFVFRTLEFEQMEIEYFVEPGTDEQSYEHEQQSGQRLALYDEEKKQHIRPGVVEPAAGLTRAALTFLIDAYEEQQLEKNDMRTVLHLHPTLAPYKLCVLPLYRKEALVP